MTAAAERPWTVISQLPSFIDRLEDYGALSVRELVADVADVPDANGDPIVPFEVGGVVYHDRGIRVPGYDATFVREEAGSRSVPAFSIQVDAVGPRSAWAVFDASIDWEAYLLRADDVVAVAWMSDGEFAAEEAVSFATKRDAVAAGRFSFGVFCHTTEEWDEQVTALERTTAPASLHHDDGSSYYPPDQPAFYDYVESSPAEFRANGGGAPPYLGLLELEVTIRE